MNFDRFYLDTDGDYFHLEKSEKGLRAVWYNLYNREWLRAYFYSNWADYASMKDYISICTLTDWEIKDIELLKLYLKL